MTEFEEKMLNQSKEQTRLLSKIRDHAFNVFCFVCIILGVIMAK